MNARLRTAAALALATLPLLAFAAKWERVADVGTAVAYVDRDSLKRNGNQVRATVEWRWSKAAETSDSGTPKQYVMERQTQVANCDNRSYAVSEGIRYADVAGTNPVGDYKYDDATLPFMVAPSRSIRDTVVLWVCAASTKKP